MALLAGFTVPVSAALFPYVVSAGQTYVTLNLSTTGLSEGYLGLGQNYARTTRNTEAEIITSSVATLAINAITNSANDNITPTQQATDRSGAQAVCGVSPGASFWATHGF